jgi:hypothetical protein
VAEAPGETWQRLTQALERGQRGLPGGSSLRQLLAQRRGYRNPKGLPPLTVAQILDWADDHHRRTGKWPGQASGPVLRAPGEKWREIQNALIRGGRGLDGGTTIAQLLSDYRGVRNIARLPPLTPAKILNWAKAHRARTGTWPYRTSGEIPEAPGEKWANIENALVLGLRGLPGGSSLAQFLAGQRT